MNFGTKTEIIMKHIAVSCAFIGIAICGIVLILNMVI
jgi:hypothetical protein